MVLVFHKWLVAGIMYLVHPFFISVTEINHNAVEKTLEISCKTFTDDLENAIQKTTNVKVDLFNVKDSAQAERAIVEYIRRHLIIRADGKPVQLEFIGFERESEATWSYFQVRDVRSVKKLEVMDNILHEISTDQINFLHVTSGGNRKSLKLNYPEAQAVFEF